MRLNRLLERWPLVNESTTLFSTIMVKTDQVHLKVLSNKKKFMANTPWSTKLMGYHPKVKYKEAKNNIMVDSLYKSLRVDISWLCVVVVHHNDKKVILGEVNMD